MYERELFLDKIAEREALVMHGTLDLTIEQWATIYDRVEWIYRRFATVKLAELVSDKDPVDYYDEETAEENEAVDACAAEERVRLRAGEKPTPTVSLEASFA